MNIGIIGSGPVGQTLGMGFVNQGHNVMIGTRDPAKLSDWLSRAGTNGGIGSFSEAAAFGNVIVVATAWSGTENAITLAHKDNFKNKVVVDVTNPLDFSQGTPRLATTYPTSACALIQTWLPVSKVVKAFNTVPAPIMVNPKQLGDATLFIAGHHDGKAFVRSIAEKWGWSDIIDMGDINAAYWVEMLAMFVIQYGFKSNNWTFALKFLRK